MASTDSKLTKLNFLPGFHKESTQYAEEGKWFEGNRVRFREGKPENLRGYAKHNSSSFEGIAKHIIFGTNKEVKVERDTIFYDVTPIVTVVSAQNIFTTDSGSTEIVTSITNHGRTAGDKIIVDRKMIEEIKTEDFGTISLILDNYVVGVIPKGN